MSEKLNGARQECMIRGCRLDWYQAEVQRIIRLDNRLLSERKAEIERLRSALSEAALQLQYMHDKFSETGSGNAVLARIKSCLRISDGSPGGVETAGLHGAATTARPSEGGGCPTPLPLEEKQ